MEADTCSISIFTSLGNCTRQELQLKNSKSQWREHLSCTSRFPKLAASKRPYDRHKQQFVQVCERFTVNMPREG